jgi:hypothetical protein
MKTEERELPVNIYANGSGFIGVVRHRGIRYYLGWEKTIVGAQELVAAFRSENPKVASKVWKPGDKL